MTEFNNTEEESSNQPPQSPPPPPSASTAAMEKDDRPLPAGWAQGTCADGRIYYIDHITRSTTWLDPRDGPVPCVPTPPAGWAEQFADLPKGWEAKLARNGRTYFVNHNDKTTTYDDPRK